MIYENSQFFFEVLFLMSAIQVLEILDAMTTPPGTRDFTPQSRK